jgi:hypothetical protein
MESDILTNATHHRHTCMSMHIDKSRNRPLSLAIHHFHIGHIAIQRACRSDFRDKTIAYKYVRILIVQDYIPQQNLSHYNPKLKLTKVKNYFQKIRPKSNSFDYF